MTKLLVKSAKILSQRVEPELDLIGDVNGSSPLLTMAAFSVLVTAFPMARKLRVQYPGAVHHVLNRGDRRKSIS
ncbi:MAG: hypothetical protein JWR19_2630 [Pedosphaera sp.]|jgi:hypothetical protein|nr:hypothetical protein [Pedosphaera sp.]